MLATAAAAVGALVLLSGGTAAVAAQTPSTGVSGAVLRQIDFADPAQCVPNPALGQVLAHLRGDATADRTSFAPTVGGMIRHTLVPEPMIDWHGLTVRSVGAGQAIGSGRTTIEIDFMEPALDALAVLDRLGFRLQAEGTARAFQSGGTASMMVLQTVGDGNGSRLTCTVG